MKKSEQIYYIGNLPVNRSLKLIHGNGYLENVDMKETGILFFLNRVIQFGYNELTYITKDKFQK